MITASEAIGLVRFTADEKRTVSKLEAMIDATIHKNFDLQPLVLNFDPPPDGKIAAAIQQRFEGGGWRVLVSADHKSFTLVPLPGFVSRPASGEAWPPAGVKSDPNELPALLTVAPAAVSSGRRLLVRMPTRGRPKQALTVLAEYRKLAGTPIAIEVVVDEDDETMQNAEVLQRLCALGCSMSVGRHGSKIGAVNGGRAGDWDVLLLASDDMVPVVDGYAVKALDAMEQHFPQLDGAVYFNDGYQAANCCTLPIIGRRWYDRFGYVYEPEYTSLFCDQEQTELWKAMGHLAYVDEVIVEHRHWVAGAPKDALYEKNDKYWEQDKAVYENRKARRSFHSQFHFGAPPMWLSICICSLHERRAQLDRLLEHLYGQILKVAPREVEVLIDARTEPSIGDKRQALVERARGHFVAFIDDDDWVSHDYVASIVGALKDNPNVDCVSLSGVMTTSGQVPERFEHSMKYDEWKNLPDLYARTPNHLNTVRRELALSVGFKPISHAEDFDFSKRLRPLLKTEVWIGEKPLYYYFYVPHEPYGGGSK
jgi:hypothetical protein